MTNGRHLGNNMFDDSIVPIVINLNQPQRYIVSELEENAKQHNSNYAVTGTYMYDK